MKTISKMVKSVSTTPPIAPPIAAPITTENKKNSFSQTLSGEFKHEYDENSVDETKNSFLNYRYFG